MLKPAAQISTYPSRTTWLVQVQVERLGLKICGSAGMKRQVRLRFCDWRGLESGVAHAALTKRWASSGSDKKDKTEFWAHGGSCLT